jgi:hypothetical protein
MDDPTSRASWTPVFAWFETALGWFFARFRRAPQYLPLVERIEHEDRDVYRLLTGVWVHRKRADEYRMSVELPDIDPRDLIATIADGRLVIEHADDPEASASASAGRRSYSCALPRDYEHTVVETRVRGDGLMLVGRKGELAPSPDMFSVSLENRWSAT